MLARIALLVATVPILVRTATVKSVSVEGLHNQGLSHLRGTSRNCWKEIQTSPEDVICIKNNVSVMQEATENGEWERFLRFGKECATQTTIRCKHSKRCESSCPGACPCDVDLSVGLAPYQQTMFEQISSLCSQGQSRVLLLGLGGGRMSQYLLDHCSGMRLEAIEISADMISLSRAYLGLGELEKTYGQRFFVEQIDGLAAVNERAGSSVEAYDAVLVDCFSKGSMVPESCRSREFAQKVKTILRPSGMLLQNIWHYSPLDGDVKIEFEKTKTIYHDVFEAALEDLIVPMPKGYRWANILKATRM